MNVDDIDLYPSGNSVDVAYLENVFNQNTKQLEILKNKLEQHNMNKIDRSYHSHVDCTMICLPLNKSDHMKDCIDECKINVLPSKEIKDILKKYPEDLQRLESNPNLMETFTRHALNPGDIRDEDVQYIPSIYSLEVSLVVIPEDAWEKCIELISKNPDIQKELVSQWKSREKTFSDQNLHERNRKVQRYSS
jgi:hypoxanthine phosphoribosyltransferase